MSLFNKISQYFVPRYFVLGVVMGFLLCCMAGYQLSKVARFSHFSRFFREIQPGTQFYPTASEMLATIKHDVTPNKILVLVGGSSILRGVGQNPDEVWTKELQRLLGKQFKVVNFGADGASITSFGAVIFRILMDDPNRKIIYLCDCGKRGNEGQMDGTATYSYLFWDAYYKKLFHPDDSEKATLVDIRKMEMKDPSKKGREMHLMSYMDSLFYFKDLWNWVSYRLVFTVWNSFANPHPFRARSRFLEESQDLKEVKVAIDKGRFPEEVDQLKQFVEATMDMEKAPYSFKDEIKAEKYLNYNSIYTPRYRKKLLCIVVPNNPKHVGQLTKQYQAAHYQLEDSAMQLLRGLNYNAVYMGKDFQYEDFHDGRHLSASGGNKVATRIVDEIKRIAERNHYYEP